MGDASEVVPSSSAITREEISANATILDEGIRLCSFCRSEVMMHFINYNQKVLMCGNKECSFPFGKERLKYKKETKENKEDEILSNIQTKSIQSSPSATMSMISTSSWSEIDKINRVYEAEEQLAQKLDSKEYYSHRNGGVSKNKEENEEEILKEVALIKKLNDELLQKEDGKPHIKNEKWIKNLMGMQKTSGVPLLNPEEMKLVGEQQVEVGLAKLKIDIDVSKENSMSSIKIEIANSKDNA